MVYKDKELLLKDLSARLPYGVKVCIKLPDHQGKTFVEQIGELKEITKYGGYLVSSKGIDYRSFNLDIKPYLRPMPSMTEEECIELSKLIPYETDAWKYIKTPVPLYIANVEQFDFFHRNHLDWRGLINKGIALEAPSDMYI